MEYGTFGWLPLSVVFCGLVAGGLFFLNMLRKDDPNQDLVRIVLGALFICAPFVWTRFFAIGIALEYSLIVLLSALVLGMGVTLFLHTQIKYAARGPDGHKHIAGITMLFGILLLMGFGFVNWHDQKHSAAQVQAGKSVPPAK